MLRDSAFADEFITAFLQVNCFYLRCSPYPNETLRALYRPQTIASPQHL